MPREINAPRMKPLDMKSSGMNPLPPPRIGKKQIYFYCPASMVHARCQDTTTLAIYNHGYITSPNYPSKYYMDADCRWMLYVQEQQSIRITLFDFELDVKRGGRCYDFLEVNKK